MRWSCFALAYVFALGLVFPAQAQVQPFSPPDTTAYTERSDLTEPGQLAGAKRVLRFVQVSDAHILDDDAPYPMRQEPLDPYITAFSTAAQRPQDEYTDEVLESVVRAINDQHAADRFQFVINTGDNIDNALENELMRFIDLWEGTTTTTGPVSGLACLPDGQSTDLADTAHDVADQCTSLPEALAANHTALAPGLPWYSAFGNHDGLIQGNVNPNEEFDAIAAEHGRHFLTQPEYVDMHFVGGDGCEAGGAEDDFGHGYGLAGDRLCDDDPDNDGYYAFSLSGVRFIVLDTLNDDFASANGFAQPVFNPQTMVGADVIGGYAEGAVDPAQMEWLRAELGANADKLIVIFSHHTVNSMFTNLADGYCQGGRCMADALNETGYGTGEDLTAELAAIPNVVGWVGGHTHRNRIEPKGAEAFGFWNIESSSLIDYPQQARVVELWVTTQGDKGFWLLENLTHGFQLSKDLEATDGQRVPEGMGDADDQDTILWFDVPDGVRLTPMPEASYTWNIDVEVSPRPVPSDKPITVSFTARDVAGKPVPRTFQEHVVARLPPESTRVVATLTVQRQGGSVVIDHVLMDLGRSQGNLTLSGSASVTLPAGDYIMEVSVFTNRFRRDLTEVNDLSSDVRTLEVVRDGGSPKGSPLPPMIALVGLAAALVVTRRRR